MITSTFYLTLLNPVQPELRHTLAGLAGIDIAAFVDQMIVAVVECLVSHEAYSASFGLQVKS